MKYPFDVNKAIMWLGENIADLVFVFFDPIGQALCKRTLNIVERLSDKNADKIKFFLSKADEAGGEGDRQRVMMQIVQELCKRPSLNRTESKAVKTAVDSKLAQAHSALAEQSASTTQRINTAETELAGKISSALEEAVAAKQLADESKQAVADAGA